MDIQDNLAKNLIRYRKDLGLTQADVAEKLNYSDKTVSKWERGESIPDLLVLKQLADLYNVKIDTLIDTPKHDKPKLSQNISKKRIIISFASVSLVWIVALLGYIFIELIYPTEHTWLSFIYAACLTSAVVLILSVVWHLYSLIATFVSMLIWTTILSIYLTLLYTLPSPPDKLWILFLLGIPLQIGTLLVVLYKKIKSNEFQLFKHNK